MKVGKKEGESNRKIASLLGKELFKLSILKSNVRQSY